MIIQYCIIVEYEILIKLHTIQIVDTYVKYYDVHGNIIWPFLTTVKRFL